MNSNLKKHAGDIWQKILKYHKEIFAEMYEQYVNVHLKETDRFGGRLKYVMFLIHRMNVVRSNVAIPFLLAELAFWLTFVIHIMNFGSVATYVGQFIPKGAWWFIIPLWIVALEILWSRAYRNWHWRHEAYYFALYRYGPDSPRSMLATIIIRLIKGSFMMGYIYVVMYGTDVRLGNIFWETAVKLWPLGALTAGLYVFQAIYGYLTFGNIWDWQKKGVLFAVTASVFGAYYAQFKLFVPNFHIPAIHLPWTWNSQPVTTFEPKYALLGLAAAVILFVIIIGIALLLNKIIDALSDDTNLDIIRDNTLNIWWVTPLIYFALLISIVSYRWYHEIYIPDRLVAIAAEAQEQEEQPTEPTAFPILTGIPATEFTLTPVFTATLGPTNTATFTATPEPLPTSTLTETPIPTQEGLEVQGLTWDSTLPKFEWTDNNGRKYYQSIGTTQGDQMIIVSNSATFVTAGDDSFALTKQEPIAGYSGCHVNINGVSPFDWKKCFVYIIENSRFQAPDIINNWLFKIAATVDEQPVFLTP